MCGITAVVSKRPSSDQRLIEQMTRALAHRGPDDQEYFRSEKIHLGHRRLSIIDLATGRQPMQTPDGNVVLVFNGEIFNFQKLRQELSMQGVSFRTRSDTEVVLWGYVTEGAKFFDRLEGMFAGVIHDRSSETTVAFRDPFGIKPLYFYEDEEALYFASEIKAIRAARNKAFTLDPSSLYPYLICGYDPRGRTLFREVRKISPGSVRTIDARGVSQEKEFSSMLAAPDRFLAKAPEGDLRSVLIEAFAKSTVSDVPVGLYLSGGMDSSLIAAILRQECGQSLDAFCISFPEHPEYDESTAARAVARNLGIHLEILEARPETWLDIEALVDTLEEPLLDPSSFALGALGQHVRDHVKVVLSGEGGDELFGGYHRYVWHPWVGRLKPMGLSWFLRGMQCIPRFHSRAKKLSDLLSYDPEERYFRLFSNWSGEESRMLEDHSRVGVDEFSRFCKEAFLKSGAIDDPSRLGWVDMVTFLREDLLIKADRMSMRHGLEVRVPYLQPEVVRAAFQDRSVLGFQTKPRLRALLKRYLPSEIVDRKKKGFEFPLDAWFRGAWKPWIHAYLSDKAVSSRGIVPVALVRSLREEHESGRKNRGRALFSLVMLEAWMRRWVD